MKTRDRRSVPRFSFLPDALTTRLKTILAVSAGALLGAGLLYLALRNADFALVWATLRDGSWGWAIPLFFVSLLSVFLRAWRWRLLLDAVPVKVGGTPENPTPLGLAFGSVLIGYLVNYTAPRLGEVARAATVSNRTEKPLAAVFGTVVAERVLDVVTLLLALLSVMILFRGEMAVVFAHYGRGLDAWFGGLPTLPTGALAALGIGAALLGIVFTLIVRRLLRGAGGRLSGLAIQFRGGLVALLNTGRVPALLASTAGIWLCYALMSDFPLRILGLSDTYNLGLLDAWALMAVGAIGMSLPSPGGAGSYHYATVQALVLLFGVAATPAATYALLGHAAQLVFYALGGFAALLWLGTSLRDVASTARAASPTE